MPDFETAVVKTYAPDPDATITLTDQSATTKTLVRSDEAQYGLTFGSSRQDGDVLICATRPGEWLLLGPAVAVATAGRAVSAGGFTSVIPFTHGRSLFRITGDAVPRMLEKVCGLDWHDDMTPNGAVVSASVALTTCDLIRNDLGGTRSYLVQCDRSFGQYLFDALLDAGAEFGITVETTS